MSIRRWYKKTPLSKRLCHGCSKTIYRNVDFLNGEPYHHGCINKTGLKPTHRCLDCLNLLTDDNVLRVNYPDSPKTQYACSLCGSFNITPLRSKQPFRGEFVELPRLSDSSLLSLSEEVQAGAAE